MNYMSEEVERIAALIWHNHHIPKHTESWNWQTEETKAQFRQAAIAVLMDKGKPAHLKIVK